MSAAPVCLYFGAGIAPDLIPGAGLDPGAIEAGAAGLVADAAGVRDGGGAVLRAWQGLGPAYQAPETGALLAVMDPVADAARVFADDVDRVAGVLRGFAGQVRVIKAALDQVRADAWAFRAKVGTSDAWTYDQDLVDENTALVRRVNAQQVALWDAERDCANAIRAIDCIAGWAPATQTGQANTYGVTDLPTDTGLAWGAAVPRADHCPKAAAVQVKGFVWDAIVVDSVGGAFTGLGALVGIDATGWHWATMQTSWGGLGALIGYDQTGGDWSWDTAGQGWTETGKSLLAWDTWDQDPARAAGVVFFNLATTILTFGGAAAAKTGLTAAGKATTVSQVMVTGARVVDLLDPLGLALVGTRSTLPRLGTLLTLTTPTTRLIDELPTTGTGHGADHLTHNLTHVEIPHVPPVPHAPEVPDVPRAHLDGADTPDDLTPEAPAGPDPGTVEHHGSHTVERVLDTVSAPARVVDRPRTTPDDLLRSSTELDAPTHPNTRAPLSDGEHAPGATTAGPAHGDRPGSDAQDGHAPGDIQEPPGPGIPGEDAIDGPSTPGQVVRDVHGVEHVVRMSDEAIALSGAPRWEDALDIELRDRGMTRSEFDSLASRPLQWLSPRALDTLTAIRRAMPRIELGDIMQKIIPTDQLRPLLDNLFTTDELRDLVGSESFEHLEEIARNRPKSARNFENVISGFVARAADVAGLDSATLYKRLGLRYPGSTFMPDQPMFAIRYARGTEAEVMYDAAAQTSRPTPRILSPEVPDLPLEVLHKMQRDVDPTTGRSAYDAMREDTFHRDDMRGDAIGRWNTAHPDAFESAAAPEAVEWYTDSATDLSNPHRGNGFSGTGPDMVPEASYGPQTFAVPPGAELWMTTTDGSQRLIAIRRDDAWVRIVDGN